MDDQTQQNEATSGFFSNTLISEFQTHFKDKFGKGLTAEEAQEICLKVAELVFRKEKKKADAIPTI